MELMYIISRSLGHSKQSALSGAGLNKEKKGLILIHYVCNAHFHWL